MKKYIGSLLLLFAAAIWGMAFAAQSSVADEIKPFTFNCLRMYIGCAVLSIFILFRDKIQHRPILPAQPTERKCLLIGGAVCGIVLFIATNLQQFGISLYPEEAAASGRSGFLTAIYVVFVPLCGVFLKKKIHFSIWIAVVLAVAGMYLLCMQNGFSGIYSGDFVVLLCSVFFTAHILSIDYYVKKTDSVKLSCVQFFVGATLSLICSLLFESVDFSVVLKAWIPIVYTGVCSTGIAYTFQIAGQKTTAPAVASILCSLESVFAVIGGWLILGETLSLREIFGCAVMFAAIILSQVSGSVKSGNMQTAEIK